MEFLYLAEDHLSLALGPSLFRNKDLREMAEDLGEDTELLRDQDQLINAILKALCFNTLVPAKGIGAYICQMEALLTNLRGRDYHEQVVRAATSEAGKILEQVLKDLLALYAYIFWGLEFESELVNRQIIPKRREGSPVLRLTIGQALEAIEKLDRMRKQDPALREKWEATGSSKTHLLPQTVKSIANGENLPTRKVLTDIIELRNEAVHTRESLPATGPSGIALELGRLHAFLCSCQESGIYPDVLRYEGSFENRNGERFVYFTDEKGKERKVRTDDRIDPRRHYYCMATNNPVHLHPVLVPKM